MLATLAKVQISAAELRTAKEELNQLRSQFVEQRTATQNALKLQLDRLRERVSKLTDLLIDGTIAKPLFDGKHNALLLEQVVIEQKLKDLEGGELAHLKQLEKTVELAIDARLLYQRASVENKRKLLKILLSNLTVSGKKVEIMLSTPFRLIAEREKDDSGGAYRGTCRTWEQLTTQLLEYFASISRAHPRA